MLNAITIAIDGDTRGIARAARSMTNQGFERTTRIAWSGGTLDGWSSPLQRSVEDCVFQARDGAACCVGPIWYRQSFGRKALEHLFNEIGDPAWIDEEQLRGNFVLFLQKGANAWLFNDAPGFAHIYASSDARFYSSSWLAARSYVGNSDIDESAAVEYVLLGAVHSNRSVAVGVSMLPLGCGVELGARRTWQRFPKGVGSGGQRFSGPDAAIEAVASRFRDVFDEAAAAFPRMTVCALSGGFDSRLIVAGLVSSGERPRLFVYGNEVSQDVSIARAIAKSESLDLSVIDKDGLNQGRRTADLECLVANALFFDGLPNDGILDAGADRETRLAQSAGGTIALNGGGGEIFRNFFHLPDRRFRALDVVRAFYRGFDSSVFRRVGALGRYETSLAASIVQSLDPGAGSSDHVTHHASANRTFVREDIELVYPLFRCHYWMGVNNSLALRSGYFATPLVDLQLLRDACLLPLAWKNAGRFESRLIATLCPRIARHSSAYGFGFVEGPGLQARLGEWAAGMRPVFARPSIAALRRSLHKTRVSPALIATWRAILGGEWRLDPVLDITCLPDDVAFSRVLAVEVVSRELGP
jgi:asparagine synthase (glutamine-hydrolysing)